MLGERDEVVDSVATVPFGDFDAILATASLAFSMARFTSAINCFRSFSAA
jgi:hypothetical protein